VSDQHADTVATAPGVPALPWRLRLHCDDVKHYDGHAFITADPKGLARSVCEGFVDDMAWIAQAHNALIIQGWRTRLARRLLGLPRLPRLRHNDGSECATGDE
jgi:hypothetical protein